MTRLADAAYLSRITSGVTSGVTNGNGVEPTGDPLVEALAREGLDPLLAAFPGAEEVELDPPPPLDLHRYHELRQEGAGAPVFDVPQRAGYWKATEHPAPEHELGVDRYVKPAEAAELLGVSLPKLSAWRKAGRIASIGLTAGEYRKARRVAGWTEDEQGWGPGIFYRLSDVERLRGEL